MADSEIILTDPARELAELCGTLQVATSQTGEKFLADCFQVEPWSREFFQIIFTIVERCALLKEIVAKIDLDEDLRGEILNHIDTIMSAFSATSMKTKWTDHGLANVGAVAVGPIKAISGLVRQQVAYRKLSSDEIGDILGQVDTLIEWLEDHQIAESDFIRQGLIEGLEHFSFRLSKLQWLGWGYTLDSLREVIAAYMILERSGASAQANPDAAAVLQKVGLLVKGIYEKVAAGKGIVETGDWLIRAYGVGSLIYQGQPVARALLGNG